MKNVIAIKLLIFTLFLGQHQQILAAERCATCPNYRTASYPREKCAIPQAPRCGTECSLNICSMIVPFILVGGVIAVILATPQDTATVHAHS